MQEICSTYQESDSQFEYVGENDQANVAVKRYFVRLDKYFAYLVVNVDIRSRQSSIHSDRNRCVWLAINYKNQKIQSGFGNYDHHIATQ